MDSKITSSRAKRAGAFTLMEMMVAMAVSGLALGAMATFVLYSARSFNAMFNYADLEQKTQIAVNTLSREIRQAQAVMYYATNELIFRDYDGNLLTYSWNPTSRALVRVKNNQAKVLLTECDYLAFEVWQRSPIQNTWSNYPTLAITNAKLVSVNWRCSRTILGVTMNTETVQNSKIVIRNNY